MIFYACVLQILLINTAVATNKTRFTHMVKHVLTICSFAVFFATIFGFYLRLSHRGRVCCGDFLPDAGSTDGYLIQMGIAWKIAIVAALAAIVVPFIVIAIYAMNSGFSRQEANVSMD